MKSDSFKKILSLTKDNQTMKVLIRKECTTLHYNYLLKSRPSLYNTLDLAFLSKLQVTLLTDEDYN